MKIEFLPIEQAEEDYQKYLRDAHNTTVFHTVEWLLSLRDGLKGKVLIGFTENFAIPLFIRGVGLFRRVYSLPYDTYGGPLVLKKVDLEIDALYSPFIYTRVVDFHGMLSAKRFRRIRVTTHLLYITGGHGTVREGYSNSLRKALRQANSRGIKIYTMSEQSELRPFYQLYLATSKRVGIKPKPYSLFRAIYDYMVPKGYAQFYIARYELEAVAGMVILKNRKMAIAWQEGYREDTLNLRPINALLDKAIRDATLQRIRVFNLGPSPPSRPGIVKFKESFGAKPYDYQIYEHVPLHFLPLKQLKGKFNLHASF